jgi:isopentenyl-diphosphate delta-isomerase
MTHSRESHLVELVDTAGRAVGQATVEVTHRAPGQLHRAFSVLLVDPAGRLLLQRRAAGKTRFPLRWANACCGHPAPGEPPASAAVRRLREELDLPAVDLTEVGVYVYRAGDPDTGRVEHEYDHVLLGRIAAGTPMRPNPDEVADLRWVPAGDLPAVIDADPPAYAPWLAGVVATLARATPRRSVPPPGAAPRSVPPGVEGRRGDR